MGIKVNHTILNLSAAVLLAVSFFSCGKQPEFAGQQVGVLTRKDAVLSTKGSGELTTASLRDRSFGLYGYYRDEGQYFDGVDAGHLLMSNARMSYVETTGSGDRWVCDPSVYWPLGSSVSFFAYAPYLDAEGSILTLPNSDVSSMLRGTYRVPADVSAQPDFCLAPPVLDWNASKGDVPVTFNHALTKVLFCFNAGGAIYEGEEHRFRVKSLTLEGVAESNKFTFGGGENGFHWDGIPRDAIEARTGSYALSVEDGTLTGATLPFLSEVEEAEGLERFLCVNGVSDGILYLLPQPMTPAARVTVEFCACLYDEGLGIWVEDESIPFDPVTVFLPETTVWYAGNTVVYSATLDVTYYIDLEFSVTLADWENNILDDTNFTHE